MNTTDKIMQEPLTKEELERELSIINSLLPNSEGEVRRLRLEKKEELEKRLAIFENPAPEDVIVIESENHRTFERDTFDIKVQTIGTKHRFTSSLYRHDIEAVDNRQEPPYRGVFPFPTIY